MTKSAKHTRVRASTKRGRRPIAASTARKAKRAAPKPSLFTEKDAAELIQKVAARADTRAARPKSIALSVPADLFDCIRSAREYLLVGWALRNDAPEEFADGMLDALSELHFADEHARRLLADEGAVTP
jgi:hypothetical protein